MESLSVDAIPQKSGKLGETSELTDTAAGQTRVTNIRTTANQCLMHLIKGMIGTGVLAMPVAYKNGGLWVSFVAVIVIGVIFGHCMYQLVICCEELCSRHNFENLDYGSVVEESFKSSSSPKLQRLSGASRTTINVFLLLTQYGFCCVYIVFVAQNIKQVIDDFSGVILHERLYMFLVGVALAPYLLIKSLKTLAPFSAFANAINVLGLGLIFYSLFSSKMDISKRNAAPTQFVTVALFFGQAMFAFEGIALVLPLQNKIEDKRDFLGCNGVLNTGMAVVVCLYSAVGFYGYLVYGDDVKGSITLNLPSAEPVSVVVKLIFVVSLFITYGIQFYVTVEIIYPGLVKGLQQRNIIVPRFGEELFRMTMLIVTLIIALIVPHIDLLISLVGAFSCSFLSLVFPPLIELITFSGTEYMTRFTFYKDVFIIALGILGCVIGTLTSVVEIFKTF